MLPPWFFQDLLKITPSKKVSAKQGINLASYLGGIEMADISQFLPGFLGVVQGIEFQLGRGQPAHPSANVPAQCSTYRPNLRMSAKN